MKTTQTQHTTHLLQIDECQICLIHFSFLVRKHHCRSCGRVVCAMCSKYRMVFNLHDTPFRVCCSCYYEYKKDRFSLSLFSDPQCPRPNPLSRGLPQPFQKTISNSFA